MQIRLLGPLEVVENGRPIPVTGAKQRALLAVLCLNANKPVSSDLLIEALWEDRPPEKPQAALQFHISRMRKLLGPGRIETRELGYVLLVAPEELDLIRFEHLLEGGGEDREQRVREALELWRGPGLADFQYEAFAQSEIARLEELRLRALEERAEHDLARGRHADVVADLEALVRQQPLRERLQAQLMLALYRSGRQADALAFYKETRHALVEELGIEPGEELQQLERQILNQDPALARPTVEQEPDPVEPTVGDGHEERKVVTTLFCDLSGFAAPAEDHDPEDLGALLAPLQVRLRAELERHGGTVEQMAGTAVMAVFGAPVAHEDDPERAVRAALTIRDWIAEQQEDLQIRFGIDTGKALVRVGVRPDAGESMAVGDVVMTAARLQEEASPGAIVVGATTHQLTAGAIAYQELEPGGAEGKGKRVRRWLAKQANDRFAIETERRSAIPLIGRADDLALLNQTYTRALKESSTQLVTIVGEPGIGKSRLVREFQAVSEGRSPVTAWRHGRCPSYGNGITFWALGQIVKEHAGILESDTPQGASEKLAAAIEPIAAERDRAWLMSRLGPLIGSGLDAPPVEQLEAFAAWRTFLESVAAQRPLILVFEDLHWAESALLAFLEHVVDWSADVPLLIVCTARPELYQRKPAWGGGKRNSSTITLSPLAEEDTARLVAALLDHVALPAQAQAVLLERAGGNPLYAEEFARMLGNRGVLGDDAIPVPETVQAVIAARIDTLQREHKALLHDAAVIGTTFWAGALASMGRAPKEAVLSGLHELARREFVRRVRASSIGEDVEYTFWHVLVRDVAYGQLPRAARARKHVAAADWIERIVGERQPDHAEFLANHYATALELFHAAGETEEAGSLVERAAQSLVLAGDRAIRLDPRHGERYYRRALALLGEGAQEWRPKILARAADAATKSAETDFDQIKRDLEEAIATLLAHGEVVAAADAMRQLSFAIFMDGGNPETHFTLAEDARRLLERKPAGPELALVYERIVQEHTLSGRNEEAIEWADKALPLLEHFGLGDEALLTRSRAAIARCNLGDLDAVEAARAVAREAVDLERGYGTFAAVNALGNLGTVEHWFGAGSAAAVEPTRAGIELASRRGLERPARWYLAGLTEHLYDIGEWDEALRLSDDVATWENQRGRSIVGTVAPPFAIRILAARGELDAAGSLVEQLLPRAREVRDVHILLPALTAAGLVEAARREESSALSLVDEVLDLTRERDDVYRLAYINDVARVCVGFGEFSRVERLLEASSPIGVRCANVVLSAGAQIADAKGEHEQAEALFAHAEQGWRDYGSVVERASALLGVGRCRIAAGRPEEAPSPLREARTLFASLGASALTEAEDLLAASLDSGDRGKDPGP